MTEMKIEMQTEVEQIVVARCQRAGYQCPGKQMQLIIACSTDARTRALTSQGEFAAKMKG